MNADPERESLTDLQLTKLRQMLAVILPTNPFYGDKFRDAAIGADDIQSLADLARIPFTTKTELLADQAANPPYGSNLTYPLFRYCRLHQTSGTHGQPLRWLDTRESWIWVLDCWRLIYSVIGLKLEDRLFFPFSFGPFLGFWAAFEGAARRGNLCLPGGGMTSSARLRFLLDNRATIVCCTPTYALRLAEVAQQEQVDLVASPVRALLVAGEPGGSIPATRQRIEQAWGARVFDHTGMTEIGSIGIECPENPGGMHLLESECIAEVVDPSKPGSPRVSPGHEGELVLTNLGRWGSPLIRYRTGDRVVIDPNPCPCGASGVRLKGGILGRTDDMMVIRGNNVYPSALEGILRSFPEIVEYRIEVDEAGPMTSLQVQLESAFAAPALGDRVCDAIRNELHFRPTVTLLPPAPCPVPR